MTGLILGGQQPTGDCMSWKELRDLWLGGVCGKKTKGKGRFADLPWPTTNWWFWAVQMFQIKAESFLQRAVG